jgi:nicotinamide mononucleotide adenylyltransferase
VSPVSDGYKKKGLIEGRHRCEMVRLALKNNDWVKLNTFEADNPAWIPTLEVLNYYKKYLDQVHGRDMRLMLLCGGDLVETFNIPNVWKTEHV